MNQFTHLKQALCRTIATRNKSLRQASCLFGIDRPLSCVLVKKRDGFVREQQQPLVNINLFWCVSRNSIESNQLVIKVKFLRL